MLKNRSGGIMKKPLHFCLLLLFSIFLMFPVTYIYKTFFGGVLFFSAFAIAFFSAFLAFLVWLKFYKEKFEGFLVFMALFFVSVIFIYFAPVTLDRSLSSFIYFYAVENGEIKKDIYDEKYFSKYIERRFTDGDKIGFLNCSDEICKPTIKTKIVYYLLYPCGKFSNTMDEYEKFKQMMNAK